MIGIETFTVDEYGQMIRECSPCFDGNLGRRERDLRLAFDCNGMVGSGLGWSCLFLQGVKVQGTEDKFGMV